MHALLTLLEQGQGAAKAEVAAVQAEAAAAQQHSASLATRMQELQDSAAAASQVRLLFSSQSTLYLLVILC